MKLIDIVLAAVVIAVLVKMGVDYNSCDGSFVRGLFWFECV